MKFFVRVSLAGLLAWGASLLNSSAQSIYLNAGSIDTGRAAKQASARAVTEFAGSQLRLVQFDGPIQPEWVAQLEQSGYRIVDFIPDNTYLVYGGAIALKSVRTSAQHVQWEGAYLASDKINPRARPAAVLTRQAAGETGDLFAVQLVGDEAVNAETLALIETMKLAPVRSVTPNEQLGFLNVIVALPTDRIEELAARPDVLSINTYTFPQRRGERQGQIIAGNLNVAGSQPSGVGYLAWLGSKGFTQEQFDLSGFIVDIADDGWDNGVAATPLNREFRKSGNAGQASRMKYSRKSTTLAESGSHGKDGHGNINVSIVGGYNNDSVSPYVDGNGYHLGLGICPYASLGNTKVFADGGTWDPTDPQEAAFIATNYSSGVRISSDSWGNTGDGSYDISSQNYDSWTRDSQPAVPGNQQVLFAFAAGNDGSGANTIGPPGSGKNIISVGAAENYNMFGTDGCDVGNTGADNANDIIDFSSRGPCDDKRIKPDIVAPGTHIQGAASFYSTYSGDGVCDKYQPVGQTNYAASSGTSHSTPAVAGGAALVYQYFINQGWGTPSPAMVKAYLMNAARYMTGVYANDTLPSNNQGMGEMNLGTAFDGIARITRDQLTNDLFTATGQSRKFYGIVSDISKPLRITLGWTDAPGSTSGNAYKNNLDLAVTVGGVTYKGNVFSGASSTSGGSADVRNNVESVFLPAGATGLVTVIVSAFNINSDGVPNYGGSTDQDFALVVANATAFTPSNYPPVLDPVGSKSIATNRLMQFTVTASDPVDSDTVSLWATGVPAWATFAGATNTASASCQFSGTTPEETGSYSVVFYTSDKDGTNSESIVIIVNDINCVSANLLTENFDDSTSVPVGWVNYLSANDTSSTHYQSSPNCRGMGLNATLQTPPVNNPTQIVFYVDASSKGGGKTASLDYKVGAGAWIELGTFISSEAGATVTFDLTGTPNLAETADVSFRFNSTYSTWYLDNVVINGLDCGGGAVVNHAPEISVAGGTSQTAATGSELAFVVTVNDADADAVTLQANAAPAGASFPSVSGAAPIQSTFTWTPAATGSYSAVFAASDGKVSVTQTVSIAVVEPAQQLLAPVIQAASDILGTQFNANWLASSNATGYRLDVATNGSFSAGGGSALLSEDFALFVRTNSGTDVSGSLDTYTHTAGWTGSKIFEDNGKAKLGASTGKGIITTPTVDLSANGGAATLKFDLGLYGTDSTLVQVLHAADGVTFVQVGADLTPPSVMATQTIEITGGTTLSKIQITGKSLSKNRFYLDNFQVGSSGEGAGSYVAGYQNRDVAAATTVAVTGLTEGVTYYYRAKAYNVTSNSPYSDVTNVTTVAGVDIPPVLGAIGNKSVTVGSNLQFQVSATPTDSDAVTLTASNLPAGATFNATNEVGTFQWLAASPTGAYSVTFYATDVNGSDEETITITVGEASTELLAPVIQAASVIQANQFNANWLASAGATGYWLDVGTNDTFTGGGGGGGTSISENIQSWTAHTGYGAWSQSIPAGTVTMTDCIVLPAAAANGAGSTGFVQLKASTGIVGLPVLNTAGTITMNISASGSARTVKLQKYNGSTWGDLTTWSGIGTTGAAFTYDVNDAGASVQLRIATPSSAIYVHDISVTSYGAGGSSYIPGYENLDVGNATTCVVTGLTENATYFYRAKAYTATSNSPYSDTTNVTTTGAVDVPPVLGAIGNKSAIWSNNLSFGVSAADAVDGDSIVLSASNLPAGATFATVTNVGTVSSTFTWNNVGPLGVYTSTFYAVDKDGTDSETITITIGDGSVPSEIVFQGFEGTPADTWSTMVIDATLVRNTTGTADTPANARVRTGSYSWQPGEGENTTEAMELAAVDVSEWSDVVMTLRVSATTTAPEDGYGMYPTEMLSVSLGLDGADFPGAADITVTGNTLTSGGIEGALWSFTATGVAATTAGVSRTVAPASGGVTADGIATVRIAVPAGATSVKLKAEVAQEYAGYFWNVDDISLTGIHNGGAANFPPAISVSPANTSKAVAVSNTLTFAVIGTEIPNDAGDTITIRAENLPAGATFPEVSGTSVLTNTFSWTPTATGTTVVSFFAGDKDGTNQVDVTIEAYDQQPGGTYYGIFAGLNQYSSGYIGSGSWLDGCVPDAMHMFTNATQRGSWRDNPTLQVLTNALGTRAAIRAAISNYASVAVAGDTFLYFHSSHGGNNASDGYTNYTKSVYLCAYDADYPDTELAADLAGFATGVKVVVMVDACFSGGLFKSALGASTRGPATGSFDLAERVSQIMAADRAEKVARGVKGLEKTVTTNEIGWVTAADYWQYSWDGDTGGAFTEAAIEGWTNGACDNATYGNQNGYASFYELWNYAKDVAVGYPGEYDPDDGTSYQTDAQAFNTNVLKSAIAGVAGDGPVADRPPTISLDPAGTNKSVVFDNSLSFTVTATDADGLAVSLVASNLPAGATAPATNGTGSVATTFAWTPGEAQVGTYNVSFSATDDDGTTLLGVKITVRDGSVTADLFISEYVEGSSNNKYIEIFNGTGGSVDLSSYALRHYNNGASTATYSLALSGTLTDGDVYVIENSSATLGVAADLSTSSSVMTFNGNDTMALAKSGANIDVVGTIGNSADFAKDVTKVRKSSVSVGTTTYDPAEWDNYAVDTTSYLGSHTFEGGGGEPPTELLAPVIQAASGVQATQFNANWLASANATGYRLDVGTNDTFSGGGGGGGQSVLASNAASMSTITNDGWSGAALGGTTYVIMTQSTSVVTSPVFSTVGFTNLTVDFRARTYGGGTKSNITVSISTNNGGAWTVMGVVHPTTNTLTALPTLTNTANLGSSQTRIRWQSLDANGTIGVGVSNLIVQGWSTGGGASSFVPGYENRDVGNVTTVAVTGLVEGVTYFYRAKAYNATSNSPYSGITSVVTTASSGTPPVLGAIGAKDVFLGDTLQFQVSATATESDAVTLTVSNKPAAATFNSTNANGTFLWSSASPTGVYSMVFTATDKDGGDSETVGITVHPLPQFGAFTASNGAPASARFVSVAGQTYQMEYTLNLAAIPVVWNLADSELGTGGTITLSDDAPVDSNRFYRISIP